MQAQRVTAAPTRGFGLEALGTSFGTLSGLGTETSTRDQLSTKQNRHWPLESLVSLLVKMFVPLVAEDVL